MLIALLTDFGTRDHYAASMKGVMAGIAPDSRFIDITHEVPPGDIASAAFSLFACFRDLPPGTIILAVVDPGVGSDRRGIAAKAGGKYLVGPDNGIFSYVFDVCSDVEVFSLREVRSANAEISMTFHGRDVFAPAAAKLACGVAIEDLGSPVIDPARLPCIHPKKDDETIYGRVLHVDRFGNVITNVPRKDLGEEFNAEAGGRLINIERSHYAEAGGEIFLISGSLGLVEISRNGASAASELGVGAGDEVVFRPGKRE